MFALVFTTRYLDLFIYFVSTYNTLMKIAFVILSYLTCYFMFFKFKTTYNKEDDNFQVLYLLIPAAVLALLVNHHLTPIEVSIPIVLTFINFALIGTGVMPYPAYLTFSYLGSRSLTLPDQYVNIENVCSFTLASDCDLCRSCES